MDIETVTEVLREAAGILGRVGWLAEALLDAGAVLPNDQLGPIRDALETTTRGLATVISEIADLIEDPEADPLGAGADLVTGLISAIDGLVELVDLLEGTEAASLDLEGGLSMLILLAAFVLDELSPGGSGLLWALGLLEIKQLPALGRPYPVTVRRAAARRFELLFTEPEAYLVDRITERESPLARSGLLAALAYYAGQPLRERGDDAEWLTAIERVRDAAMSSDLAVDQAVLLGKYFGPEQFAGAAVYVTENDEDSRVRLGITPVVIGLTSRTIDFDDQWSLRLAAELPSPAVALELEADPATDTITTEVGANFTTDVSAEIELARSPSGGGNTERTAGEQGGTTAHGVRLGLLAIDTDSIEFRVGLGLDATPSSVAVSAHAALKNVKVGLSFSDADSFLQGVVPQEGLAAGFDLEVGWSEETGFVVTGAVELELVVPVNVSLGPITLDRLYLAASYDGETVKLEAATAVRGEIGPLKVAVERMGVESRLTFPEGGGNLGPAELAADFRPPTGVGLSLEAGPVTGAGYINLEPEIGRYSGFLSLRVSEFAVTALGLVQVDLPQPGPEYSLLILITAEFPGIQIGYGLTLNGIGGIFGLHRRIDADALRGDVASGSVSALLDPGSRLDNPGQLIAQLESYFPTAADHFVVGLSVQLRWVELVRLDIGVMIELPGPNKIVILGRAVIAIGSEDVAIVRIQLEILGIIDFEEKLLSIDAALRDSSLLEVFEITGGAAIRLSWGERPYAVMSVGGFHPEFVPEPAVIPVPERVGLSYGQPDEWFYLRLGTYVAITTGSFQLGAAVEVRLNLEVIAAEGMLAFDALIVFDPFYFSVGFSASFRVTLFGISLAGVSMNGTLSGPGPVTFAGEVCIEILGAEACWSGSFAIGSEAPAEIADVDSVLARLAAELRTDALSPRPPSLAGAELKTDGQEEPHFDPGGGVGWTQGLVPLGVILERLEGAPLGAPVEVDVQLVGSPLEVEEAFDWFAPASFADLSDAEAINQKSFERLRAGFALGGDARPLSTSVARLELRPDVYLLGNAEPTRGESAEAFPDAVLRAAIGRAGRSSPAIAPALGLSEETWHVHTDASEEKPPLSETAAHRRARHRQGVALPADDEITIGAL